MVEKENKCQWCGSTNYDCIKESGKCSNCDDMEEKIVSDKIRVIYTRIGEAYKNNDINKIVDLCGELENQTKKECIEVIATQYNMLNGYGYMLGESKKTLKFTLKTLKLVGNKLSETLED